MTSKIAGISLLLLGITLNLVGCVSPGTTTASPEVRGRVVDASTKQPIAGALIQITERPSLKAFSDPDGRFRLPGSSDFHFVAIPGSCGWGHFPQERPYSDLLTVSRAGYGTLEIHAKELLPSSSSYPGPAQIEAADILLRRQSR